jgi:hypothetical protein
MRPHVKPLVCLYRDRVKADISSLLFLACCYSTWTGGRTFTIADTDFNTRELKTCALTVPVAMPLSSLEARNLCSMASHGHVPS